MYATLTMGGSNQSHKKIDSSRSWILYQYYNNKVSLSSLNKPDDSRIQTNYLKPV